MLPPLPAFTHPTRQDEPVVRRSLQRLPAIGRAAQHAIADGATPPKAGIRGRRPVLRQTLRLGRPQRSSGSGDRGGTGC